MKRLALFLLLAPACFAQTVEIAGGSSSLLQASGASATVHFPDSSASFSAGEAYGRMGFSGDYSRSLKGWDVSVGDRPFNALAGSGAVAFGVRGLSATRHIEGGRCNGPVRAARGPIYGAGAPCWVRPSTLTVFVGATGPTYAAPFFVAGSNQHFGAGLFYRTEIVHGMESATLVTLAGPQRTALQSLTYQNAMLKLQGTGGVLTNVRYWNYSFDLHPVRLVDFNASRTTYYFATVNSAGASMQAGPLNVHGAMFESATARGQSYGAGLRASIFELRADAFKARTGTVKNFMLGERITRKLTLQQFTDGRSFNLGGTFTSNYFALSVSQAEYFMPLNPARPFQRALALQLSFRVPHDTATTIATNLDPTGHLRYGAYASSFVYGSWQP